GRAAGRAVRPGGARTDEQQGQQRQTDDTGRRPHGTLARRVACASGRKRSSRAFHATRSTINPPRVARVLWETHADVSPGRLPWTRPPTLLIIFGPSPRFRVAPPRGDRLGPFRPRRSLYNQWRPRGAGPAGTGAVHETE